MLRRTTSAAAGAALAAALAAGAAAEAGALVLAPFAPADDAAAAAVVRLQLPAGEEGAYAECTGTAVGARWVLTARHCVEESPVAAGAVLIGQGADVTVARVNDWALAPAGDLALVHVTSDLGVAAVPVSGAALAEGDQVLGYGWSSLGQGALGRLPRTGLTVRDTGEQADYGGDLAYLTKSDFPASLQEGDSGGPILAGGELVGVLSMGVSFTPPIPPELTGLYVHAAVSTQLDWIRSVLATDPAGPAPDAPGVPGAPGGSGSAVFPMPLPGLDAIAGSFGSLGSDRLLPAR
ncbi:hypothetical protein CSPHI_01265 [Corynebacterium sphenisci DSM 44792]|uniref:Peptidase S1 domain-containing protein n=1 Tax=Corynebacterium sphenisci DSM 44792 TaxID=1437874 RepID=A0A1L7CVV9_9CORY|nr:S1 family peptidase [Corynebacterium sphenisci]APT89941.1 hypothetical protein CSPHI_01265 [Corynebacterium sphenisci DSM 44792]